MSLDIFSSNSSSSFIGGRDLVVGNPKVSVSSYLVGFRKWYAFHLTRRRKKSVLSIKHFKYPMGFAIGMFFVEY